MASNFENEVYLRRGGGRSTIKTIDGVSAVHEAIESLKKQKPVVPLNWSTAMAYATKDHVEDIGPKGLVSHAGT